ncbi:MAG: deoxyribodipyrimidine photolyase [Nitrosopumilus sp. BACL13 MAG-121220-bin23]|jgi:deoxyribodipyrimidine photo-lyase|nr:MAG: deoxyribodipyrimidine photolyase [Nitrosopumilus sp. BACL13 MAG-121220-bin23]
MYKKTLFIFRRDLRIEDNIGLIESLQNSKEVIPCFIYDENIIKKLKDSKFRWNFLNESLVDLDNELKKKGTSLQILEGKPEKIIDNMIKKYNLNAIFLNTDFTNYAQRRDEKIFQICKKNKISFHSTLDFLLHNPNEIKTNEGSPYTIYSFFYKKARQFPIKKIIKNIQKNYSNEVISDNEIKKSEIKNNKIIGGRKEALKILKDLDKFRDYDKVRDFPGLNQTTMLSAHNKFGTISVREVHKEIKEVLGSNHTIMGEIYWREFFSHILFHFPYAQKTTFRKKFQKIPWSKSKESFKKWSEGETGFPIVDAGMRQLNQTGFMHNRVRMVVASFLTKDLHMDWKLGEKYFEEKLIDHDPAVNSGNWQWAASTGCDSVPYFRIFNPWRQQERFDLNCDYIKKWIPELEKVEPKIIHKLWEKFPEDLEYPKPMLIHKIEAEKTKLIFKSQK